MAPGRVHFKSEGERRIAYFLDDNSIRYQYEPGVLISDPHEKIRLWYLDFGLPEFSAYIEYFGLAGKPGYDEGIKAKLATFQKMEMDVIPVYPWTFRDNWQRYIMTGLEKITTRRYDSLKSKKYWHR
ncbi:MAG: hypothetical protein AB2L22_13205 [Syntrophales bacterium]